MAKGDTTFALVEWLEPQANQIFARLNEQRFLQGLPRPLFLHVASRFLADLNALHPFREGNGRTQRAFLRLLAAEAGWRLDWGKVESSENASVSAAAMSNGLAFVPLLDRIAHPLR